jgi:hypothetical protein
MNHTAAQPYGVRIDAAKLLHAMRVRGLTGAAVARRSREIAEREGGVSVSQATISHAVNGRRVHPTTLRAIHAVLRAVPPLDDIEALILDVGPRDRRPRVVRGGQASDRES